jgi:putative ABC transport system permease protein
VVLDGGDSTGARSVNTQFVTPNYFGVLGVSLSAGMGLRRGEDDTPDMSAVMSYETAEQLYGSAAAAVGKRIVVNEMPVHLVGVTAPRFQGAVRDMHDPVLWMPVSARANVLRVSPRWATNEASLSPFARLASGASREQASALARQVVTGALPDSAARVGMSRMAGVLALQGAPPGKAADELIFAVTVITTAGILILLVGWMNVSSLMVAAAVGRRHEIAVRLSLGASRKRLLQQLVTESTLLALIGGAAGLTAAYWFLAYNQKTEIHGVDVTPDLGTFAFVLAVAVATGILFGLSPALHATRTGVANALRDSGTGAGTRSRLQRGFVVAQIALSQPLLVFLGMMLTLILVEYKPIAPETSRHIISVHLRPLVGTGAPQQRAEAVDSLVPRIAERPEVVGAVPEPTAFDIRGIYARDAQARTTSSDTNVTVVNVQGTAPGYFSMFDVPIVLGRDVSFADTAAAEYPVVVPSDLARRLWGSANPVDRTLASPVLNGMKQDSISMTVVGVYDAGARLPGMSWGGAQARTNAPAQVYTAHGKGWLHDRILVRTRGPALGFVPELRRFIRVKAPSMPLASILTIEQSDRQVYEDTLRMAALAGAGGVLALLLASLGLYGVVSLAVRQRTREIGIRIAVGAEPAAVAVAGMFLKSGVRTSVIALAIGLPLSVAALKIGMAQGTVIAPDANPYVIGAVIATLLIGVASAASWGPARRAAKVDPARTLRVE